MTAKTNKAVFIFLAALFSLEFFKKGILLLLRKSYSLLQAEFSEALSTIQF